MGEIKGLMAAILLVGHCESCKHYDTDGEQGEIECCNHEVADNDFPFQENEGMGNRVLCPFWTSDLFYCKEHNEIYINNPAKCSQCFDEYIKEQGIP